MHPYPPEARSRRAAGSCPKLAHTTGNLSENLRELPHHILQPTGREHGRPGLGLWQQQGRNPPPHPLPEALHAQVVWWMRCWLGSEGRCAIIYIMRQVLRRSPPPPPLNGSRPGLGSRPSAVRVLALPLAHPPTHPPWLLARCPRLLKTALCFDLPPPPRTSTSYMAEARGDH